MGVIDRAEPSLAAIAPELGAGDLVVIGVPTSDRARDAARLF